MQAALVFWRAALALQVIKMIDNNKVVQVLRESWKAEIDAAVDALKQPARTELDRWFRHEWHREEAVSKWPEWRQECYRQWRRKQKQLKQPRHLTGEEEEWRQIKEEKHRRVAWTNKAIRGLS